MWEYEKLVWARGWSEFRRRIRESWRSMIAYFTQTVVLFALLYLMPWLGDLSGEARAVAALVGSVALSFVLLFVWDIARAPHLVDNDRLDQIWAMRKYLRVEGEAEAAATEGRTLYEEGLRLVGGNADDQELDVWEARAAAFVRDHYDGRCYLSYLHGVGYRSEPTPLRDKAFYRTRLDRLHAILLTYSTIEQQRMDDLRQIFSDRMMRATERVAGREAS